MPTASHHRSAASPATPWLCGLLLVVAVLGGGGRGGLGDVLAQILAVLLLAHLCWQGVHDRLHWRAALWVRWLPALALALPILQLVPIPEGLWALGTARAELATQLLQAGVTPPHVITLNPTGTEQALWSLLPATALFLATLVVSRKGQQALLLTIVALAIASVLLGMAQLADGTTSPLRLYRPTNADQAVGFFANRNHFAGLLAMALPLAFTSTGWAVTERLAGRPLSPLVILSGCVLVSLLILGIALSRSRAGMLLGMVGVLGSLPIVMGLSRQRGTKRILAVILGVAIMLSAQFALLGMLQRLDTNTLDDGRWKYARITGQAALAYSPLGSGLGTFKQAYQPFEAKSNPDRYVINHAHDDYVELWLEGGLPALLLISLGTIAWSWRGLRLWRRDAASGAPDSLTLLLTRTAWLSASLALLHSALDYPLRTTASMSVFAILGAIAFSEPRRKRQDATLQPPEPASDREVWLSMTKDIAR